MKYTKFFNSNPSVSGNNAMSNIEALAKFDTWLAGQKIINISVGESQYTYTPLTFTKENGETYTVNIPTVKGATGATGLEALSITRVYESAVTPSVNGAVVLKTDDFNRAPTTNERAIMYVVTNDSPDVAKTYITGVTVNSISDTTVNCVYNFVTEISLAAVSSGGVNYVGDWTSGSDYHKGDIVNALKMDTYDSFGGTYLCIEDINPSNTNPTDDRTHWLGLGVRYVHNYFGYTQNSNVGDRYYLNYTIEELTRFSISASVIGGNNSGDIITHYATITSPDLKTSLSLQVVATNTSGGEPSVITMKELLVILASKKISCFGYSNKLHKLSSVYDDESGFITAIGTTAYQSNYLALDVIV